MACGVFFFTESLLTACWTVPNLLKLGFDCVSEGVLIPESLGIDVELKSLDDCHELRSIHL